MIKNMKTIVGYTFTDTITNELLAAGFPFKKNDSTLKDGYCEYLFTLEPNADNLQGIEIREVLDEVTYITNKNKKDFSPYVHELNNSSSQAPMAPNSIFKINSIITEKNLDEGTLKLFLKLRKSHSLWALELQCHDFNKFVEKAKPELFFDWKNKKAALIHFGSSCFDLLVTEP